jgi:hypothetical protein
MKEPFIKNKGVPIYPPWLFIPVERNRNSWTVKMVFEVLDEILRGNVSKLHLRPNPKKNIVYETLCQS